MLRDRDVPVCDADAEVHKLYEGAAVAPIESAFPRTTKDGRVDRQALSAALLANPAGFKTLESIVHPLVQTAERAFLHAAHASGALAAVLEIPLLFETGGDRRCDAVIVVSAPPDVQRARVLARPGMTPEKLAAILGRQHPDEIKRGRADFVVDTGGTLAWTAEQVDKVMAALVGRQAIAFGRDWQ
jgi:dephospho-CoA kinase